MKKFIFIILAILINYNLIYPNTMIITEINREEDTVIMQCLDGNYFAFYGVEDYTEGDLVSCIMFSNGTKEVYDDIILYSRYSGVAEWFMEIYSNY